MPTIGDFSPPASLDGTEKLAGWKDGSDVGILVSQILDKASSEFSGALPRIEAALSQALATIDGELDEAISSVKLAGDNEISQISDHGLQNVSGKSVARGKVVDANIFDPARAVLNRVLNPGNGVTSSDDPAYARAVSGFVQVQPGGTFSTLTAIGTSRNGGGAFYADVTEASFVSGSAFAPQAAGATVAVPSTANFVQFNLTQDQIGSVHLVHGPVAPSVYRAFDQPDTATVRKLINAERTARPDPAGNLYDATKALLNQQIITTTGTFQSASGNFGATIDINGGETVYFTHGDTSGNSALCWCDAYGRVIASSASIPARTAITAPQGTATLKFSLKIAAANDPVTGVADPAQNLGVYLNGIPSTIKAGSDLLDLAQQRHEMIVAARATMPRNLDLYVDRDCTPGKLITSAGQIIDAAGNYRITGLIEIDDTEPLCLNVETAGGAGNFNYGVCYFGRTKQFLRSNSGSATITTTAGSSTIVVSGLTNAMALQVGTPVQAAGIPTKSYIATRPAGGGNGEYTIANAKKFADRGDASKNTPASATASNVSMTFGGALPNIPITTPPGIGICYVQTSLDASSNPTKTVITNGETTSSGAGYIGWGDMIAQYPFFGLPIAILGDSKANDTTGDNLYQEGIEAGLKANAVIQGARGGIRISEVLFYKQGPHTSYLDEKPVGDTPVPITESDIAGVALVVNEAITNDAMVHNYSASSTTNDPKLIYPAYGCTPIGTLADRWIPTHFRAAVSGTSLTILSVDYGTLQDGMPVHGDAVADANGYNELVAVSGGGWRLARAAVGSTGNAAIYGGTLNSDLYDLWVRKVSTYNKYARRVQMGPQPRFEDVKYHRQCGPWPGNPRNGIGLTNADYNNAMRDFCEAYGVYFIDLMRGGLLNEANYDTFFADGLHEDRSGYIDLILPYITGEINRAGRHGRA